MKDKKILIVQLRTNPEIRAHDASSYERLLTGRIAFDIKDATEQSIALADIKHYDGYIIGGSHFMPYQDFPQKSKLYDLVRYAIESKKPFLGVCFGFEILVEVLGGTILHEKARKEFGTLTLKRTANSDGDPLLKNIPPEFVAQEAHESFATELPTNCVLLARGEGVEIQMIRCGTSAIYGTQFHPEMSKENMHERMAMYNRDIQSTYTFGEKDFDVMKESRDSEHIILNFADLVLE
ncbi:MAG: type 1 glutamine amidotransferase [bacterium]|nr:type 1 glutamine amidotransferase [bacterium]